MPDEKPKTEGPDEKPKTGNPQTQLIVVKREVPIAGNKTLSPGDEVAIVELRPGIGFNWLVDSARNGFIGIKKGE